MNKFDEAMQHMKQRFGHDIDFIGRKA